jgi:hypothetical protein
VNDTWNGWPEESSGLHEVILCPRERKILRVTLALLFLFFLGFGTGAWLIYQARDRHVPREFVGREYPGFPSAPDTPHFSRSAQK